MWQAGIAPKIQGGLAPATVYNSGIRTYKQVTTASGATTYNYNLMGATITFEERTGANACDLYYAYDANGKLYGLYYNRMLFFYKRVF